MEQRRLWGREGKRKALASHLDLPGFQILQFSPTFMRTPGVSIIHILCREGN
jgi:hypothetical protein